MASVQTLDVSIDPGAIRCSEQLHSCLCRNSQRTENHINQLDTRKHLRMKRCILASRQEFSNAGSDRSLRDEHAHALRNHEWSAFFSDQKAVSVPCSRNTKGRFVLLAKKVGEVRS